MLRALGLTWSALGHDRSAADQVGRSSRVAEYEYTDLDGRVQARKLRLVPKSFYWERLDASAPSGWRKKLDGFQPTLYRIEYAIDAKRILVTEGEKAVDLLRSLGAIAVCPPTGAKRWLPEWTGLLWRIGCREVVVLADADGAGRRHALVVVETCYRWRPDLSASVADDPWPDVRLELGDYDAEPLVVRLIEPPGLNHYEDTFDWLTSHGHGITELLALIDSVAPWAPVDPVQRRRALTRERVRRYRARKREQASGPVTRERSLPDPLKKSLSCRDQIPRSVTRYESGAEPEQNARRSGGAR